MDWLKVDLLVEKYYSGYTTVEEEQYLREVFQSTDVPERFITEQMIFGNLGTATEESSYTSAINWNDISTTAKKKPKLVWLKPINGIAASLLLFAVSYGVYTNLNAPNKQKAVAEMVINGKVVQDEEMIRLEALQALALVSKKMNKTTEQTKKLQKIEKSLNVLNIR